MRHLQVYIIIMWIKYLKRVLFLACGNTVVLLFISKDTTQADGSTEGKRKLLPMETKYINNGMVKPHQ